MPHFREIPVELSIASCPPPPQHRTFNSWLWRTASFFLGKLMSNGITRVRSILVVVLVCLTGSALWPAIEQAIHIYQSSRQISIASKSIVELTGGSSQSVKRCVTPGSGCGVSDTCPAGTQHGSPCQPTTPPANPVVGVSYGSCHICTAASDVVCVTLTGSSPNCTTTGSILCPGSNFTCQYMANGTYRSNFTGTGCVSGMSYSTCF